MRGANQRALTQERKNVEKHPWPSERINVMGRRFRALWSGSYARVTGSMRAPIVNCEPGLDVMGNPDNPGATASARFGMRGFVTVFLQLASTIHLLSTPHQPSLFGLLSILYLKTVYNYL